MKIQEKILFIVEGTAFEKKREEIPFKKAKITIIKKTIIII